MPEFTKDKYIIDWKLCRKVLEVLSRYRTFDTDDGDCDNNDDVIEASNEFNLEIKRQDNLK